MKKIILFMFIVFTTIFSVEKVEEPIFINLLEFYKEGKPYTGEVEGYGGEDINLLYEKANYKDGFLDGKYTRYNSKGEIIGEVIFDKGKIVSGEISTKDTPQKNYYTITTYNGDRAIIKKYYDDGSVLEKECKVNIIKESRTSIYDDGVGKYYILDIIEDGMAKEYSDGKLVKEFHYKNGELDGEYKEYFKNGNLKVEGFYEKGKAKGIFKSYFVTGELYQEKIFNDENVLGEIKEYFKTGELYSDGKLFDEKKSAFHKIYSIFGDIVKSEEYIDGKKIDTYYNSNLDYCAEGWIFKVDEDHDFYKKSKEKIKVKIKEIENGEYDIYYDNGQLKQRVIYKDGVEIGESIIYDRTGEIQNKINYTEIINKKQAIESDEKKHKIFKKVSYILIGIILLRGGIKILKSCQKTLPENREIDYTVLCIGIIEKIIRFTLIKISLNSEMNLGTITISKLITLISLAFINMYSKKDKKYKRKYFNYFIGIMVLSWIILGLLTQNIMENTIKMLGYNYEIAEVEKRLFSITVMIGICEVLLQSFVYQWMKKISYKENQIKEKLGLEEKSWKLINELGIKEAQTKLGVSFEEKRNLELVEKYYKSSSDKGDKRAQYFLGILYKEQEKIDLAEKYLKLASDQGNEEAQYFLGILYEEQRKIDLAEEYLKLASDQGMKEAQFYLGVFYYKQKSTYLAEKYWKLASNQGVKEAQHNIKILYDEQREIEIIGDYEKFSR